MEWLVILAQDLPLSEAAEIVERLDIVQSLVLVLILTLFVVVLLVGVVVYTLRSMNRKLTEESQESVHFFTLIRELQTDYRILSANYTKSLQTFSDGFKLLRNAVRILRERVDNEEKLGERLDEVVDVIAEETEKWSELVDATQPIRDKLLDQLDQLEENNLD